MIGEQIFYMGGVWRLLLTPGWNANLIVVYLKKASTSLAASDIQMRHQYYNDLKCCMRAFLIPVPCAATPWSLTAAHHHTVVRPTLNKWAMLQYSDVSASLHKATATDFGTFTHT